VLGSVTDKELIADTRMLQVVTNSCKEECKALLGCHTIEHPALSCKIKYGLGHVDNVKPIVIWIVEHFPSNIADEYCNG